MAPTASSSSTWRRVFDSAAYIFKGAEIDPVAQTIIVALTTGVTCSLSRSGDVWDNAAMESFFSSLKVERVARKIYRTRDQARADVFDYIERFYNPRRRHSTIGYISPMDFEQRVRLA